MTIIVPLVALLAIGIAHFVSGIAGPTGEITTIGYVDEVGEFQQYTSQGNIMLVRFDTPEDATKALVSNDITEYFIIPSNYASTGALQHYTLEKQLTTPPASTTAIKKFISSNLLAGRVSPSTIELIEAPLNLVTTRLTATGAVATEQGRLGNFIIPGIFSSLLCLSIIFSSTRLLQGLGEEKENRLIEILLSSVSPWQLLTGKILGMGAAGLAQVVVWVISAPFLLSLASSTFGGFIGTIQLPANFLVLTTVYFILGYLLFAVLSASIGAISSNSQEGQQLIGIFTLPLFIPIWFMSPLMEFPNNPIWIVLTILPITSPVEVVMRLGISDVPAWELVASIAALGLSITGLLLLTTRVFRAYLLMYGKRPGIREIIRSLRSE